MMARKATARTAARPGLRRRCLVSSLTYTVASHPVYMNTAIRKPDARLPFPPIPLTLSQPEVIGKVPWWWPSTSARPQIAKTIRIAYSTAAMPTWVRAVRRMPTTAITSMTTMTAVLIPMFGHVLVAAAPKTARTEGARTTTPEIAPTRVPVIISQPARKPRYGLIARPTHSKEAPQLAFHKFSLR